MLSSFPGSFLLILNISIDNLLKNDGCSYMIVLLYLMLILKMRKLLLLEEKGDIDPKWDIKRLFIKVGFG